MRRAALLLPLLIVACGLPPERSTLDVQDLTVTITNPGPGSLTGDPARAGDGPALRVQGDRITPTGAAVSWCRSESGSWACNLPVIPVGHLDVTFQDAGDGGASRIRQASLYAYRDGRGAVPVIRLWPPLLP